MGTSLERTAVDSARWRWVMLAVVQCATMMGVIDTFIVNLAIPSIQRDLRAELAEVQLVAAGYTLGYAVMLVTGGRLGDLYGRKRLFMIGVAGFTLFSTLCGLASSILWLVVFRTCQGALAALMLPQVIALIQTSFDVSERPVAFGIHSASAGLASILGQVLGGLLLAANLYGLGWRSVFLINIPIGLIVLVVAVPLVREARLGATRRLDYGGVALLTLALSLLVFPVVRGGSTGWPLWTKVCLILSGPCGLAFLAHERHIASQGHTPLVSLALFRVRRYTAGILTMMISSGLFAPLLFLLAFYLQTVLGLTPLQSSLVLMPLSVSFILGSSASAAFAQLLKNAGLSIAAATISLGYLLVLLAVRYLVPQLGSTPLLVALSVVGCGMGLLGTPLLQRTLEGVPHDEVGTASGIYTTASQTASALGVAVIGLLFAALSAGTSELLHAFVISLILMTGLSLGLSIAVLPFRQLR